MSTRGKRTAGGKVAVTEATPAPVAATPSVEIAVVVCTYNRYDLIGDTLASLDQQTLDHSAYEVVVVDNSTDLERQKKFWRLSPVIGNCRLITERIPGLSRARNIGMRETQAPIIAYIDDDAVATPEWLETLVSVFADNPDAGAAGGPVDPVWTYPATEPRWLHPWQQGFLTIIDHGPGRRRLAKNEWLVGTNIAYRRPLLLEAGGFSESLGRVGSSLLSNEEMAVSRILEANGYASYYDERARVMHRVHADRVSQAWMRRRVSWQTVSDQLTGSTAPDDDALWERIHAYLQELPVQMRGVRGLLLATQDRDQFQKQCSAIDALMMLLLASGRDPEERG